MKIIQKGKDYKNKMLKITALFVLNAVLFASCAVIPGLSTDTDTKGYKMISVQDLQNLMETEKFIFVNVHLPLEGNIPGTAAEIPFDDVESYLDLLPVDKDEKIVLYCRSGSMGNTASQTLVDLGYTDVSNLEGGYNAWKAADLPFEE